MKDGNLVITMAAGANHSVSVSHDAPFDDGIVQVRFKLRDAKGIKFNFNDPKANKVSWAGHIARVVVTPKSVSIGDDKKGVFDLKIREQRQNKDISKRDKAKPRIRYIRHCDDRRPQDLVAGQLVTSSKRFINRQKPDCQDPLPSSPALRFAPRRVADTGRLMPIRL